VVVRSGSANSDGTAFWPFPFTQQIIAETLGLTPVHVNRMLRERRLVEVTHGMPRVNNLDELAAIGEFGARYLRLRSTSASDREDDLLGVVMNRPFQRSSPTGHVDLKEERARWAVRAEDRDAGRRPVLFGAWTGLPTGEDLNGSPLNH